MHIRDPALSMEMLRAGMNAQVSRTFEFNSMVTETLTVNETIGGLQTRDTVHYQGTSEVHPHSARTVNGVLERL